MQQTKDDQKQQKLKKVSQTQNSPQRHRKQALFPPRHCTQTHPKMPNASQYDPWHNWTLPILHPRKTVPSRNQPHQNTHSLTPAASSRPNFSPGTQSE